MNNEPNQPDKHSIELSKPIDQDKQKERIYFEEMIDILRSCKQQFDNYFSNDKLESIAKEGERAFLLIEEVKKLSDAEFRKKIDQQHMVDTLTQIKDFFEITQKAEKLQNDIQTATMEFKEKSEKFILDKSGRYDRTDVIDRLSKAYMMGGWAIYGDDKNRKAVCYYIDEIARLKAERPVREDYITNLVRNIRSVLAQCVDSYFKLRYWQFHYYYLLTRIIEELSGVTDFDKNYDVFTPYVNNVRDIRQRGGLDSEIAREQLNQARQLQQSWEAKFNKIFELGLTKPEQLA
ncbi:hypothetical protein A3F08_00955 [Candidatus Berkelbacteria bacterium RIFCSPHIGHO2_12_FULL_36_9]|uniref:Uncharacterized protein n=1 Tax=Candidatus Berkelbacteria bacterium RIFCSPHIGHO2_12_FULL_36_9 TaxID=1797469 RepID=A0A1F5EI73_9BACT|nr:MAG: hypothetical protein A3F08_00955 [Candidatus Berkelbacteria bacterium RIFCSPHIGHO2_12_FULL_36_9]